MAASAEARTIKALYSAAARCFLTSDHVGALDQLERALASLPAPAVDEHGLASWARRILDGAATTEPADELDEWRRKLAILLVTVLATALSQPLPARPRHRYLDGFKGLKADDAASRLFALACSLFDPTPTPILAAELPLPGPSAARLPPSVTVALLLGALKLDSPRVGQAMAEAYFGSVPEPIELLLEATCDQAPSPDPNASVNGGGGGDASLSLSDSFVAPRSASGALGGAVRKTPAEALLASYERLLDLYALHVLPRLDRWQEADEWIRLLGRDNGGIVRQAKVESLLASLAQVNAQHIRLAEARHARELEAAAASRREAERKTAAKAAKRKARPSATPNGKRASSSSASSPPAGPSSSKPINGSSRAAESPSSYAEKRSSIARFIGASAPASTSSTRIDSVGSAWARLVELVQRVDLLRASSVLAALFVILAWRRRARSLDVRQRLLAGLGRVRDTISMGTRSSYL